MLHSEQKDNITPSWSTLVGESKEGEDSKTTFQRTINELLNLKLKEKDIYPVYDYVYEAQDKVNYVFYAEVKRPQEFNPRKEGVYSWLAFSETSKLLFTARTEQDVIVGERVINLKLRLAQNLQ